MTTKLILPGTVTPLDDTPYAECPEIPAKDIAISMKDKNFEQLVSDRLHQWGFLLVTDYGFKPSLIESCVQTWRKFFTSSEENKRKWLYNNINEIGYVPPGSGSSLSNIPDKKEYCSVKPRHPDFSLPKGKQYEKTVSLLHKLEEVGLTILDAIEKKCPVNFPYLNGLRAKATNCEHVIMRVNYFPPASDDDHPDMVPAGKHTDVGLITVLIPAPDDAPGLVLWDRQGKKWRVPYVPNALVINVGDILSILSGGIPHFTGRNNHGNGKVYPQGYYPSTLHGVDKVDSRTIDRITIPVFMHVNSDQIIAGPADTRVSGDQAMKGSLANEQIVDIFRAMHIKGGLTGDIFRDARLGNHGIGKKIESAEEYSDTD